MQLPNHPPLSPIPYQPPAVSVSPAPADEQVDRLAIQLELTNLSSPGEPEWDNYFRTPPTYNDQREFWDSRYEVFVGDSETDPKILSPATTESEEVRKIELVETLSSQIGSENDLITVVGNKASTM